MNNLEDNLKIGILGCGAIGAGIAKSTTKELEGLCQLAGLFDSDPQQAKELADSISQPSIICYSYDDLLNSCDLIVEAVSSDDTNNLIKKALEAGKHILVMSVGKVLLHPELIALAEKNNKSLLIPSGAIAGIDALKAASLTPIEEITLTTRKPPSGLKGIPYLSERGMDLDSITEETVLFEGSVAEAVQHFPRNINVAATLALATNSQSKLKIRIITSPDFKNNSHEIHATGAFGKISTITENKVSPENPRTSYLAVLSGIQTVKDFCSQVKIGT